MAITCKKALATVVMKLYFFGEHLGKDLLKLFIYKGFNGRRIGL